MDMLQMFNSNQLACLFFVCLFFGVMNGWSRGTFRGFVAGFMILPGLFGVVYALTLIFPAR